mmetsp:Transcript_119236/g.334035  ORF Transcript_119236/g.334035 Transcript_119236/m.334035 type:complete len:218 (+) Transcript_119236:486-1139(+)
MREAKMKRKRTPGGSRCELLRSGLLKMAEVTSLRIVCISGMGVKLLRKCYYRLDMLPPLSRKLSNWRGHPRIWTPRRANLRRNRTNQNPRQYLKTRVLLRCAGQLLLGLKDTACAGSMMIYPCLRPLEVKVMKTPRRYLSKNATNYKNDGGGEDGSSRGRFCRKSSIAPHRSPMVDRSLELSSHVFSFSILIPATRFDFSHHPSSRPRPQLPSLFFV